MKFQERELIRKYFKLTQTNTDIVVCLFYNKQPLTIIDLKKRLKKERTTIQKSIMVLLKKGLVTKRQINLNRGFMFTYSLIPRDSFFYQLYKINHDNYAVEHKTLQDLEERLKQ